MSINKQSWILQANCANEDINIFFPLRYTSSTVSHAFKCCQTCKVKKECLYEAMITESHGIWSGTTEHQRSNLLHKVFQGNTKNITIDKIEEIIDNDYYLASTSFIRKSRY